MRILAWTLQILILSAGIHLFLRFVRTTRGNRMIRGLLVTVLGGVVGLWGLSVWLDLEELRHLLEISSGIVVITLAIVFQPELRRGIGQLGAHSFVGRLIHSAGKDTVARVVRASRSMATRRVGALIAFERETSLQNYIEDGTPIDAAVNTRLIESIFHPGTTLHDGAIIVRRDRIAAAGCFFPLPQEGEIDAWMGTRHRAAMGLTEDSDAIVLVVSEETGRVSIAREGRIATNIASDRLEDELRDILAGRESGADPVRHRVVPATFAAWRRDFLWLLGSVLAACAILFVAHQDIRETRPFQVRIVGTSPSLRRPPVSGEILVVLPGESQIQVSPEPSQLFPIEVEGSRAQLETIEVGLRGVLEVSSPDWRGGALDLDDVQWENRGLGLSYRWKPERAPALEVEEFGTRELPLVFSAEMLDDSALDPRYEVRWEEVQFSPAAQVTVRGPTSSLEELGTSIPLHLRRVVLKPENHSDLSVRLRLTEPLLDRRFSLIDEPPVEMVVPILPTRREAGGVSREIALICLDPERAGELARWQLPAHGQLARFTIETSGLIPVNADPGSPAVVERFNAIRRFVEENLMVFVDLSDLPPAGEGRTVPVRWSWRRDWRQSLDSLGLDTAQVGDRAELDVRLDSETEILLETEEPGGNG